MKVTQMQLLFARDWPARLALVMGASIAIALSSFGWLPLFGLGGWTVLCGGFHIVLSAAVGYFGSLIVFWPIIGPLYYHRGRRNGAPYVVGDHVQILVGEFRGRVARVYDIWDERLQVRVELDNEHRDQVKDVFSYVEIRRHRPPDSPPTAMDVPGRTVPGIRKSGRRRVGH